jgi:hypothetical protein
MSLSELVSALQEFKAKHPASNKADVERFLASFAHPRKERSVFITQDCCFRFSEANTGSFSNVVLSLSALQKYDSLPVVICIVRPDRLDFRLANATFLKRISHSSHTLRADNIRGSFLGHDIMDDYDGIPNRPEHFEELMAIHVEFGWDENVQRLVEATNSIIARSMRFQPTPSELEILRNAPHRAAAVIKTDGFADSERGLSEIVERNRDRLLGAAALENVNLRGNTIEQIITGAVNAHRIDDLVFDLATGERLIVDIKTKLLDRASAPKAYNIDKMLRTLSQGDASFAFFFIGLNVAQQIARSRLVSIFDPVIVRATRIQTHWAGRASRGVTQLTGDLSRIFETTYHASVDVEAGEALLRSFIER